jgi:hypothetical protein
MLMGMQSLRHKTTACRGRSRAAEAVREAAARREDDVQE